MTRGTTSPRPVRGAVMAEALEAQRLVELRDRWLNPPAWVEWVDEPVPACRKPPIANGDI